MPGERVLSEQEANARAIGLYWQMEKITRTYNSGPRWGGAINNDGAIIGASYDGLVDAPAGERWPLSITGDINLQQVFPDRKIFGTGSITYRDLDAPRMPTNREDSTQADAIDRQQKMLETQRIVSGWSQPKSLTIHVYASLPTPEIEAAAENGFKPQTDIYVDHRGNYAINGSDPRFPVGRPFMHGQVLSRTESLPFRFTSQLADIAKFALDLFAYPKRGFKTKRRTRNDTFRELCLGSGFRGFGFAFN